MAKRPAARAAKKPGRGAKAAAKSAGAKSAAKSRAAKGATPKAATPKGRAAKAAKYQQAGAPWWKQFL